MHDSKIATFCLARNKSNRQVGLIDDDPSDKMWYSHGRNDRIDSYTYRGIIARILKDLQDVHLYTLLKNMVHAVLIIVTNVIEQIVNFIRSCTQVLREIRKEI